MLLIAKQQKVAQRVHGLSELMRRPPYLTGGRGQMKLRALLEYLQKLTPAAVGSKVAPPAALAVGEFQASRAKFLKRPLHFDPTLWFKETPLAGRSKVLCSGQSFVDVQLHGPTGARS